MGKAMSSMFIEFIIRRRHIILLDSLFHVRQEFNITKVMICNNRYNHLLYVYSFTFTFSEKVICGGMGQDRAKLRNRLL
jgi:hypothetical protein